MTQENGGGVGGGNQTAEGAAQGKHAPWHRPLPETLPKPTPWPAVLAFGVTLLAWGVVTSWAISAVGLVMFGAGIGGWIGRMRREEQGRP